MLAITVDSRFPFAVSPECCSCPCFSNGVVSLTLRKRSHRKIVSHSAGHSIFNRQNKKPIHRNIKNQREFFSRFKMMFYVTALKFKDGTVIAPIHSLTVPKRIEWWVTVFSLSIPTALGGFATSQSYIVFNCKPSFKGIIFYCTERMFVNAFLKKLRNLLKNC